MRLLVSVVFLLIIGCSTDPVSDCTSEVPSSKWTKLDQTQLQNDIQAIDAYLTSKGITATKDPSGLRYIITQAGTGDNLPCLENVIAVSYEGRLMSNGTVFDSSELAAFIPSRLIVGWQIGLLKLNKGAKITMYIPSGLAYGSQSSSSFPANSNLIFDMQLVDYR